MNVISHALKEEAKDENVGSFRSIQLFQFRWEKRYVFNKRGKF